MNWRAFETSVPGKWVLAGEHSVLKGTFAIAMPHPELQLKLKFEPSSAAELVVSPSEARPMVEALFEQMLQNLGVSLPKPQGQLTIESSIPMGAGLGSSGAFCVALARWWKETFPHSYQGVSLPQELVLAKTLEDRFHGKSSGMDVAVSFAAEAILFSMQDGPQRLRIKQFPRFTFHDTGHRAKTKDCIAQVDRFRRNHPEWAFRMDEQMGNAAEMACEGLVDFDEGRQAEGLNLLQKAMQEAQECFQVWGLIPAGIEALERQLLNQGALAVKLTGAGGGGFLVALWPDQ